MKIVLVGPFPVSLDYICGGVESSVLGLSESLVTAEHEVDVFDYPRIGGKDTVEHIGQLTVHRYNNNGKRNRDAVTREKDILRDILALHPDVVHLHGTGELILALHKAITDYGIKAVLTVHGLMREEKKNSLLRHPSITHLYQYIYQTKAESEILSLADNVIVDTEYVAERINRYYTEKKISRLPKIHVIPQGINKEYFNISCSSSSKTLLSVGAISPRKGHLQTLQMFNLLRCWGTEATLRIIGSLADEKYLELLQKEVERSPYKTDISIEINISQEELFKAYSTSEIFVLHSHEESQGIVFAEAMATEMPVVATRVGGIPNVVTSGKCGFLCDLGNIRTMAEMVERLLTDKQLWVSFSNSAKSSALQYDWKRIAAQILNLYKQ